MECIDQPCPYCGDSLYIDKDFVKYCKECKELIR